MVAASVVGGVVALASACASAACMFPGGRERQYAQEQLRALPGVAHVRVFCTDDFLATSELCAEIEMSDGASLLFFGVGYKAFGPNATRVWVREAGRRSPTIVGCGSSVRGFADIHRGGQFGHQFSPAISDITEAIRRHKEIAVKLEFWPECPQFWEVHDAQGARHRYCAHAATAAAEAPRPPECR